MVRAALPVALGLLFLPLASGLTFEVNIADITNHTVKDLEYQNETEVVQEISGSVENIGSIGCTFRMKGEFTQGNSTFERYSAPAELWQGGYERMNLRYVPMNYTGIVDTDLYLEYCGQEKQIEEFEFNVTENTLPGADIESRTTEADSRQASVEISSGDTLVPEESPSYWKLGSAQVVNSSATLEYDAPIFSEDEVLRYTVLEDGEVIGSTEVSLERQPTRIERLMQYRLEALAALLIASVLINLHLLASVKGWKEKIPEYEIPDFRKTD